jgi:hypothetical protein
MPGSHGDGAQGRVMFLSTGTGAANKYLVFKNFLKKIYDNDNHLTCQNTHRNVCSFMSVFCQ